MTLYERCHLLETDSKSKVMEICSYVVFYKFIDLAPKFRSLIHFG